MVQRDSFTNLPIPTDLTLHTHKAYDENNNSATLLVVLGKSHRAVFGDSHGYLGMTISILFSHNLFSFLPDPDWL